MYKSYADALRREFGIDRKKNRRLFNIGVALLKKYGEEKKIDVDKVVNKALSKVSKEDFIKEVLNREEIIVEKDDSKVIDTSYKKDMSEPRYVYMMKIYVDNEFSGIVKVGFSKNIAKREQQFNGAISEFGYSARKYMHVECKNVHEAKTLEQSLHLIFDKFKYTPSHEFDGSTELFNYNERMDTLFNFKYL